MRHLPCIDLKSICISIKKDNFNFLTVGAYQITFIYILEFNLVYGIWLFCFQNRSHCLIVHVCPFRKNRAPLIFCFWGIVSSSFPSPQSSCNPYFSVYVTGSSSCIILTSFCTWWLYQMYLLALQKGILTHFRVCNCHFTWVMWLILVSAIFYVKSHSTPFFLHS